MHNPKYSNTCKLILRKNSNNIKHSHLNLKMSHGQPKKPQPDHEISNYGQVLAVSSALNDGNVRGKSVEFHSPVVPTGLGSAAIDGDPITIGEALESVAISVGDKAVDQNDAAAISAAEIRASGETTLRSGGVGETAQAAATFNSHVMRAQDMKKLSDILTDATEKLPVDKAVTKEDAEAVHAAEVQFPRRREAAEVVAESVGVAASMATAADLNERN